MEKLHRLHLDFEVFSHKDADVTVVGASRHARHPHTEPLMLSYAFDDEPTQQWVPAERVAPRASFTVDKVWLWHIMQTMPTRLRLALRDPKYVKIAWNKPYEWNIFKHVLGIHIPHDQWRDTMVLAYSVSLPGALKTVGTVIDLPVELQKDSRGDTLIRKFCSYRTPTAKKPWNRDNHETAPEEWAAFKFYNVRDTDSERAVWHRLRRYNMPRQEWELWFIDQEINEKGVPVNLKVCRKAQELYEAVIDDRMETMRAITGLNNPNSPSQLLPWLQDNGYPFDDLKKGHVAKALQMALDNQTNDHTNAFEYADYIKILEYRQETSKTSVKKYKAFEQAVDTDGLFRNSLQFAGAGRTQRWAGRKVQLQNLARPAPYLDKIDVQIAAVRRLERLATRDMLILYDKPMDVLSTCVRPTIQAPEGFVFIDADLNAIENRGIGWLANDRKILKVFEEDRCPYIDFATYMFKQDYDTLWHEYKTLKKKDKRTLAKPPVLGCFGPSTEVLTDAGWLPMSKVKTHHRVHDGESWVTHLGVIDQGVRQTIARWGIAGTRDHLVLSETGWTRFEDIDKRRVCRLDRFAKTLTQTLKNQGILNLFPQEKPAFGIKTGEQRVFDIAHAGPNNRYIINGYHGPMIVHNCGYGLGPGHEIENKKTGEIEGTGLLGYAWNMGVNMTPQQTAHAVDIWRTIYTDVVEYWYDLDRAAKRCLRTGKPQQSGRLSFDIAGPFLRMKLPSGRYIHYIRPLMKLMPTPWGEQRETLTYEGLNDKNQWTRIATRGAKLLENATQAWARDILAHGMVLAHKRGIDIRFHVHDQIVGLARANEAEDCLKMMIECMEVRPEWGLDIPLKSEGLISPCFVKD